MNGGIFGDVTATRCRCLDDMATVCYRIISRQDMIPQEGTYQESAHVDIMPSAALLSAPAPVPKAPSIAPSRKSARSRHISVREVTTARDDARSDTDGHSIAAMSYATSRAPKMTRIFEVAEVIPGERPLSVVTGQTMISASKVSS